MSDETTVYKAGESPDLLDMVTRFYQSVFTLSPEELVPQILTEAARVFEADIAAWFLVTEDRTQLRLVDLYSDGGEVAWRPEIVPYELNWAAANEFEVRGLTAWVAISGTPLFVPTLDSLLNEHGMSHLGKWDRWLYPEPDLIHDPHSGFLCFYAVPLFSPIEAPTVQERIVGVLKVERRSYRKKAFTEEERKAFDVIANIMGFAYIHSERQKSLTLIDIGHTLIRPLGDVAFSLDVVAEGLREDQAHERETLDAASKELRGLSSMLKTIKDSVSDPTGIESVNLSEFLAPQLDAFSLHHGREISMSPTHDLTVNLTKRALSALLNVVVNLIDNAMRYSPPESAVGIQLLNEGDNIILRIESAGVQVSADDLQAARSAQEGTDLFKGLPRSYQLAARNGWDLKHSYKEGRNRFDLKVSLSSGGGMKQ